MNYLFLCPNPFTLGHEVFGEVVAVGPEATNVTVGDKRIVYPWIGCSNCEVCSNGDEHLCNAGPCYWRYAARAVLVIML
jgi:D-arabinose 1-dehydrogenase-like Zn-dependent alcohol dehydrogenase